MQGITPYVDLRATLINTKTSKFTKNWRLWPSTPTGKDKRLIDWSAFKPAKLIARELRRTQTILVGSIRPPHRLKYTKHIDHDTCPYYACYGAKAIPNTSFGNVNNGNMSETLTCTNYTFIKAKLAHKQNENKPLTPWYAYHASSNAAFA